MKSRETEADRETASMHEFFNSGTGPLNTPFYIKDLNIIGFMGSCEKLPADIKETLNGCVNLHSIWRQWISVTRFKRQKERSLSRQEEEKRNTL